MKHKVSCALCERKEIILLDKETGKIKSKWAYFGKFNINTDKTTKYSYKLENCNKPRKFKRILNSSYNPKIKPKYVEYWECPECYEKEDNKHN